MKYILPTTKVEKEMSGQDISLDDLLRDGFVILSREVRNLMIASVSGKLGRDEARDLRETLKLLVELKERQKDLIEDLSTEELEKMLTDDNKEDN